MRFTVTFAAGALRDLESLPGPITWALIAFCDGPLSENPHRVGKALRTQLSGLHSARRGEYRVIYGIDDAGITVDVIRVRHRGRTYGR